MSKYSETHKKIDRYKYIVYTSHNKHIDKMSQNMQLALAADLFNFLDQQDGDSILHSLSERAETFLILSGANMGSFERLYWMAEHYNHKSIAKMITKLSTNEASNTDKRNCKLMAVILENLDITSWDKFYNQAVNGHSRYANMLLPTLISSIRSCC